MSITQSSCSNKRHDGQRFTDVSKEPDRLLPSLLPIVQLNSDVSSSLIEAVKPIHHLVEDLPNRVMYSLEKCKNPKDGLTNDESASIFLYTQQWPEGKISFYTIFNRALRDENRAKLVPFHQYLNLFLSAFHKLPSIQDRIWRGETGDWGAIYQSGTIHVWWGVSSCTDMVRVTGDFLDQTKKRTLFNIKCMNGKVIKNHSEFPDESETVLPPGTYLKVRSSLNATPDLCIVDLEEIVPTPEETAQLSAANAASDIISSISQVDNISVLWLVSNVNESQESKKIQEKLKQLFHNSFHLFEEPEEAINYMQDEQNQHFLLITDEQTGRQIVPKVSDLSQLKFIIIYCINKEENEQWSKDYEKIKAVVVEADEMIKEVEKLYKNLTKQQESLPSECIKGSNIICTTTTGEARDQLQLLDGLMDQPLLSLEKSLRGVTHIIPNLKKYIDISMMRCKNPAECLTLNESAAIHIYTMEWEPNESCLYRLLNQDLSSLDRNALKKWFPYLRLFLRALNKLPSYKGTVWRGARCNLSDTYIVGELGTWWNISSTAASMAILESPLYMGQQDARTLFSIECMNGKPISKHSYFEKEDEILLLPGFHFEVTSHLDAGNGLHIVGLKEIDPSYELMKHCARQIYGTRISRQKMCKKVISFITGRLHTHKNTHKFRL